MIPRSQRSLFKDQSLGGSDNAYIRRTSCMQGDAACKGGGGVGRWSAPGMVQCRGTREIGKGQKPEPETRILTVWMLANGGPMKKL